MRPGMHRNDRLLRSNANMLVWWSSVPRTRWSQLSEYAIERKCGRPLYSPSGSWAASKLMMSSPRNCCSSAMQSLMQSEKVT